LKNRNALILAFGLLLVFAIVGRSWRRNGDNENGDLDLEFSSEDLDKLGDQLSELEFEDLEGLEASTSLNFTSIDLDNLEEALQALSFEDLEGLSEN